MAQIAQALENLQTAFSKDLVAMNLYFLHIVTAENWPDVLA